MFQTEDNCEEKAATRCRRDMTMNKCYRLGIDIGSTTVKIAVLDDENHFLFSDYERHFANIQETLADLLTKAVDKLGSHRYLSGDHRFRRTDAGTVSGCAIRTGGRRRGRSPADLCSADGRCHRAGR